MYDQRADETITVEVTVTVTEAIVKGKATKIKPTGGSLSCAVVVIHRNS